MEILRQKNVATYITFPLVDADGDFVTGCTGLDSNIDQWSDGGAPDGFGTCNQEASEIGGSGVYSLSLIQAEMNNDYIVITIASNEAKTQMILIRTMIGDPLNISVHSAADIWSEGGRALTTPNDYKATGFSVHAAADIWSVGARVITGGVLTTPADYKANVTDMATNTNVDANETKIDTVITNIGNLNDPTEQEIWEYGTRTLSTPNDYKATGFAVASEYDVVIAALQTDLDNPNQYKADVSAIVITGGVLTTPADYKATGFSVPNEYDGVISALQTDLDNPNQYKATVTDMATETNVNANETKIDALATELLRIRGLNGEFIVAEYTFVGDDNTVIELWQYDNVGNFNTHDKSTGLIGSWILNNTFTDNKPTVVKSKRLT